MDMLVKLYAIANKPNENLVHEGIAIKKAYIGDKSMILEFVKLNFPDEAVWIHECEYALFNNPITCYIAVKQKKVIGFACYDATTKGFFGPMGVREDFRGKGVGQELLLRALNSMRESGYAYAVIGWVAQDAIEFYKKTVNAIEIEDSPPDKSIYKNSISQS